MQVTRWTDTKKENIDDALLGLTTHDGDTLKGTRVQWTNLNTTKIVNENQEMQVDNRRILFNIVTYSYDQIIENDALSVEDRTSRRSGKIIVYYEDEQSVKYIINRNSDAQKVLRFLLGYSSKNEVVWDQPVLDTDMFDWLIKKIYSKENNIELENNEVNLSIDNLVGFKGHPADEGKIVSVVSTEGTTVMNILSTLSFLLESEEVKQIEFNTSYGNHENIKLLLAKRVLGSDMTKYEGVFDDEQNDASVKEAKVYLLCYLKILPGIIQSYELAKDGVDNDDVDGDSWSKDIHAKFLREVANDLQGKIDLRLKQIE
ncbi:hypothetical protein [Lactiplantibacillus plantarum]|uniref:hypothetical protein n=1 Tax=Lactiplantibacillus plantarum TaxID=1590 RepID=UPI003B50FEA5